MPRPLTASLALALLVATSADAQVLPGIPGGAAPLGGMPDVSKMGLPNVAGVLGYCVRNQLLGSGAAAAAGTLKGKPGIASSADFRAGEAGEIRTGSGAAPVSLDSLPANLKSQVCELVLQRGISLL